MFLRGFQSTPLSDEGRISSVPPDAAAAETFQSTPLSDEGRILQTYGRMLGNAGFNPRPSVMKGESFSMPKDGVLDALFQSTPLSDEGRIRRMLRSSPGKAGFNPRPSVMKGESHLRQTLENNGQFASVARTFGGWARCESTACRSETGRQVKTIHCSARGTPRRVAGAWGSRRLIAQEAIRSRLHESSRVRKPRSLSVRRCDKGAGCPRWL